MDFFNDDFGFADVPHLKQNKSVTKKEDKNKSRGGVDDIDDIMNELLTKEKKRNEKQKKNQIPSFNSTDNFDKNPKPLFSTFQKKENFDSLEFNKHDNTFGKTYQPNFNKQNQKINFEEKGWDDNKSFKSGGTAKGSVPPFQPKELFKVPSNTEMSLEYAEPRGSMRNNMKPPLRRRNDSKAGSDVGLDDFGQGTDLHEIESVSFNRPPLPRKDPSPPKQTIPGKNLENQKLQKEIKQLKQQRQKQAKAQQELKREIKELNEEKEKQKKNHIEQIEKAKRAEKEQRKKLIKQIQTEKQREKDLTEKRMKENSDRMKEIFEWEIKRKSESYQLEIQRLKKLVEVTMQAGLNSATAQFNNKLDFELQKVKVRQREVQLRAKKLQEREKFVSTKQRSIQSREQQFQNWRRKEENKLQQNRRQLYRVQSQFQKKKLEQQRKYEQDKQNMVSSLSKQQFEMQQKKERLAIDRQSLDMQRSLFEKEKREYEQFNANIMNQYKKKLKEVDIEKQSLHNKQVELYQKIQTVELMGELKQHKRIDKTESYLDSEQVQNRKKEGNKQLNRTEKIKSMKQQKDDKDKVAERKKEEQRQIELNKGKLLNGQKTNLNSYLLKLNKDNNKVRPFLS